MTPSHQATKTIQDLSRAAYAAGMRAEQQRLTEILQKLYKDAPAATRAVLMKVMREVGL